MKKVIQNYFYNIGYQFVTLFVPFLTVPYITRVMEPEYLGIEAYTFSIITIFIAFATAGTTIYAIRTIANLRSSKEEVSKVSYNLFLFRTITTGFVFIILLFVSIKLNYQYFIYLQLFYFFANTFFDCTWYFIGHERFKEITLRNVIVKILGFFLTILFVKDENDLYIYILITGLTILLPNIYFTWKFFREIGRPHWDYFSLRYFKALINSLIPFFLMAIIIQIYMNLDKLILEYKGFTYELGIYNQMIKTFLVFLGPLTAVGTVLLPYISNLNKNKSKQNMENVIHLSSNIILLIGSPIFWGLLLISNQFVGTYFGPEFAKYQDLFKIGCLLILTGSIYNVIIQQVIFPNMLEKIYLKGLFFATLIRAFLLIILIDIFLLYAVLLAYVLSEVFVLVWCISKTKNVVNLNAILFNINNFKIFFAGFLMFLILNLFDFNIFLTVLYGCLLYPAMLIVLKENLTRKLIKNKLIL